MPYLEKVTTTRWKLNGRKVKPNTPGAKKTTEKSKKWYAVWKDGGKVVARVALCQDKRAAQAKMVDLDRQREQEGALLVDPFKGAKKKAIDEWVALYLADLTATGRTQKYIQDTRNTISRVNRLLEIKCCDDYKVEKVEEWLKGLTCSSRRKNDCRNAPFYFLNWMVEKRHLRENPLARVMTFEKVAKQKRRALKLEDLEKLLVVARERPLNAAMMVRRGNNKGLLLGKVKEATRQAKIALGLERWLVYKTAVLTGLRRKELKALKVCHLHLEDKPYLHLPGHLTKNGNDANLPLQKEHASELKQFVAGKGEQDSVFRIPGAATCMDNLRRDLLAAGIPVEDAKGRVFVWHCFRKQTVSLLNKAGVHDRIRKLFLRHADANLTDHYDDGELHDLRPACEALPALIYRSPEERLLAQQKQDEALKQVNEQASEEYAKYRDYAPKQD